MSDKQRTVKKPAHTPELPEAIKGAMRAVGVREFHETYINGGFKPMLTIDKRPDGQWRLIYNRAFLEEADIK